MNRQSPSFDARESFKRAFTAHQSGHLDTAESHYREILSAEPENVHANHLLGVIALQKGRLEEACELIEAAIELDGGHAPFHCNLGEAYRLRGRFDDAEAHLAAALELQPRYPQAITNLGMMLHQRGRHAEAAGRFQQVIDMAGASTDACNRLGLARFAGGEFGAAVSAFRSAVALEPRHVEANNNLGAALLEQGDVETAAFVLQEAVSIDPGFADAWSNLARARLARSELESAEGCARRAVEIAPDQTRCHLVLGLVLRDARRPAEAESALRRSLELDPGQAMAHYLLGTVHVGAGRFAEAEASLKRALELDATLTIALEALSRIRTYGAGDLPELERLERFARELGSQSVSRMHLEFALAKMLDDCGEYDRAFPHLALANALRRKQVRFEPEALRRMLDEIIARLNRDVIERKARLGSDSEVPILIAGMPRSGVALVAQVLAAHPEVSGAGDEGALGAAARALALRTGSAYPASLDGLDDSMAREIADGYLERLGSGPGSLVRACDAQPGNVVHLGLFALLFPRARIVHCDRDPLDTCFSIFRRNFDDGNEFACDFEHIAAYFQFHRELMDHWRSLFPQRIVEVRYEDLVQDPERATRELLEGCGLGWDPRCLSPHESDREMRAAGQWQPRQPLHSRSLGRWRRYERHLQALIEALSRRGCAARDS